MRTFKKRLLPNLMTAGLTVITTIGTYSCITLYNSSSGRDSVQLKIDTELVASAATTKHQDRYVDDANSCMMHALKRLNELTALRDALKADRPVSDSIRAAAVRAIKEAQIDKSTLAGHPAEVTNLPKEYHSAVAGVIQAEISAWTIVQTQPSFKGMTSASEVALGERLELAFNEYKAAAIEAQVADHEVALFRETTKAIQDAIQRQNKHELERISSSQKQAMGGLTFCVLVVAALFILAFRGDPPIPIPPKPDTSNLQDQDNAPKEPDVKARAVGAGS